MRRGVPIFSRPTKNGRYWYCHVRLPDGERRQRALHIRDDGSKKSERAAVAAYWAEQARATAGGLDPRREPKRLDQALRAIQKQQNLAELTDHAHGNTLREARHLLAHFKADFDLYTLTTDAAGEALVDYATEARKTRSAVSVKRELMGLQRAMSAVGLTPPKLPELGDTRHKPQQPLNPEELRRFFLAAKPHHRFVCLALPLLGIRASEWNKITEIDWARRMLFCDGTKTDRSPRWIPIPEELFELMDEQRRRGEWTGFPNIPRDAIDHIVRSTCKRAGIGARSANDLRGTYATALSLQGVSAAERAALQGNSELMQQRTYSQPHLQPEALRGAVDKLPRITRARTKTNNEETGT
jgi:integrase